MGTQDEEKPRRAKFSVSGIEIHRCEARVQSGDRFGDRCLHSAYSRVWTPENPKHDPAITPGLSPGNGMIQRWLCSTHTGVWYRAGRRAPNPDFFYDEALVATGTNTGTKPR